MVRVRVVNIPISVEDIANVCDRFASDTIAAIILELLASTDTRAAL